MGHTYFVSLRNVHIHVITVMHYVIMYNGVVLARPPKTERREAWYLLYVYLCANNPDILPCKIVNQYTDEICGVYIRCPRGLRLFLLNFMSNIYYREGADSLLISRSQ